MASLDGTYGCLFLTVMYSLQKLSSRSLLDWFGLHSFSAALWAASCAQFWFYLENYIRTDKLWLKIYVILLWILGTVYVVMVFKFLYIYFVGEFGNTDYVNNLPRDINESAPFSPVIAAMVQAFFVMRAWNLSNHSYFVTGGLSFLVLAQLTAITTYVAKTRPLSHLGQLTSIIKYERAMNVIVFINDTVIGLTLMYYLWSRCSGFQQTQHIIKRIVALTIGTGLITGIMMLAAFVAAEVFPNSLIYILLDFCVAKMYYNCMLASLNARSSLRESLRGASNGMSFHLDDLPTRSVKAQYAPRAVQVSVAGPSIPFEEHSPTATECRVDIRINHESDVKNAGPSKTLLHETGDSFWTV